MLIGINQWHARKVCSGVLCNMLCNSCKKVLNHIKNLICIFHIFIFQIGIFIALLLKSHDHIETNPGPKIKSSRCFLCCYWNDDSILTHDNLSVLTAYNSTQI